jgi:hypothetical protein
VGELIGTPWGHVVSLYFGLDNGPYNINLQILS